MNTNNTPQPPAEPAPHQEVHEDVDLSCESVAGEEDPGASLDLSDAPVPVQPASAQKVPE